MTTSRETSPTAAPSARAEAAEEVVPLRHPFRYVAAVFVLAALACMITGLAVNRNVEIGGIGQYLFNPLILHGAWLTIVIAVVSQLIGVVLGLVVALMRQSSNFVLSSIAWLYIWFFRGTPLLVQLVFWADFGALYQSFVLGIPFTHISVGSIAVNTVLTNVVAGIVGLSLNEGAYMAEIVRGSLLSVDEGQHEAAMSLGMARGLMMRRVILPQAIRVMIPPTGNEFISMLKSTAMLELISAGELFTQASDIYSRTFQEIPLLIVASLWYLAMTSVLTVGQYYLERHFARGSVRSLPPTPIQRLRRRFS
jgi:polar amino acid transport system permease protein